MQPLNTLEPSSLVTPEPEGMLGIGLHTFRIKHQHGQDPSLSGV